MPDPSPERLTGLLGGTFDPVHRGHMNLAEQLHRLGHLEQTFFLPAAVPPHKRNRAVTPGHHRLAMLRLAVADRPDCFVSDFEVRQQRICYTIDTMAHFARTYGDRLRLVIGMDSLRDLHKWYRAADLVREYRLLIYVRPGYPRPDRGDLVARFGEAGAERLEAAIVEAEPRDVSATAIRRAVAAGKKVGHLLPAGVWRYIQEHGLYEKSSG